MSIWLNYHHLHYFYKIVEAGSISKAALELRIGQPTLSSQLKDLEGRLGILFERKSRSLILTERGKIVFKYAKDIFSRGDELLGVLERGQLALQRELTFGAQEGVPKAIISQAVQRIHKTTSLKVRVMEGEAPFLLDNLLEGKTDLVVFDHELTHHQGTIHYLPVGQERVFLWGTKEYKKLTRNFPHSLSGIPMILPGVGHSLRQAVENFFISFDLDLEIAIEAPDTALVKELGRSGVGLVALGEETAKAWEEAGSLHKIGMLPHTQTYVLGILKKFLKDPLSDIIVKEFRKKKIP
jgi:LysR family transcriptional activator of nhaA